MIEPYGSLVIPRGWQPVYLSPEVYAHLDKNARTWNRSISEYTDIDIRRIIFPPASDHPFASARFLALASPPASRARAQISDSAARYASGPISLPSSQELS